MPVAGGNIAICFERMPGEVMLVDVGIYLLIILINDGKEFQAFALSLYNRALGSCVGLVAPQA